MKLEKEKEEEEKDTILIFVLKYSNFNRASRSLAKTGFFLWVFLCFFRVSF